MLPAIEGLLILQDRDRRAQDLTVQLEKLPADEARAKGRLEHDEQAVATAKKALQDNEIAMKNVELDADTRRTTITRLRQQQFETRKNEEYRALGNEIDRYTAEVDGLETKQLELMENADELRKNLASAEGELAKSRAVVDDDLKAIAARADNLRAELASVKEERAKLAAEVDPDLLSLYDRLLKKKGGIAVAPVKGGQCGGCHVKLVAATLIKVQSSPTPTQCETCGRILYPGD